MEDILASVDLGSGRSIHLAALARDTLEGSGAEHLGYLGYFVFESSNVPGEGGIDVLGKAASFDAAMRLIDVFERGQAAAIASSNRRRSRVHDRPQQIAAIVPHAVHGSADGS